MFEARTKWIQVFKGFIFNELVNFTALDLVKQKPVDFYLHGFFNRQKKKYLVASAFISSYYWNHNCILIKKVYQFIEFNLL